MRDCNTDNSGGSSRKQSTSCSAERATSGHDIVDDDIDAITRQIYRSTCKCFASILYSTRAIFVSLAFLIIYALEDVGTDFQR